MTFPPSNANIIRNEAGEPIGWDVPGEPEYDPDDFLPQGDDDSDEEDYPPGMGHRQDTWPDLDRRCEEYIRMAFDVLNQAPGQRDTYARVQGKLAEAIRILRGMS